MKPLRVVLLICLASVFVTGLQFAQGNLGRVSGSIADPTGAFIPGVRLTFRNVETNTTHVVTSSEEGIYAIHGLSPGIYRVEAEKAGFKKFIIERASVLTATTTGVDVRMELGEIADSVTVSEDPVALQTTSAESGTVMQRQEILDLPIEVGGSGARTGASGRRQPETFIFLAPGVVGDQWSKRINGGQQFSQEILVDGISYQFADTNSFDANSTPPYEAIQEFKVQNTLFPAEYGRGVGVINYTLKSGTNQFHGTLFEFFRNDMFDAKPFFAASKPRVRYNEFGGNFGGSILVPKVYNGKDKTFFNFNWTGLRFC